MASYALDEFLGPVALKDMGQKFAEDGWDNVPTLKVIGAEDMEALNLTPAQRDALELRIYLHNRSLMKYADRMEASRLGLVWLVTMKPRELVSKFKMRKSHVTAFVDTTMGCDIEMPPDLPRVLSARKRSSLASRFITEGANPMRYMKLPKPKPVLKPPPFELHKSTLSDAANSPPRKSNVGEKLGNLRNFYARNSPRRKSNVGELGFIRNGGARFSPPRKSSAGELGFRNVRMSPPRKSNVGDSGWNSPPRMSNASELGWNSPPRRSIALEFANFRTGHAKISPALMSSASELGSRYTRMSSPRKSSAGESTGFNGWNSRSRRSNAGEFANFRNGHSRISPARMSSAGELGSRTGFARMSPPRKSSAGELGFSGWSSPPRKSNVGELGFNGNPFPREVPARKPSIGDFTFNGHSFHRTCSSPPRRSCAGPPWGFDQPLCVRPSDVNSSRRGLIAPKGMFAPASTKRQLCGMVKAPSSDKVAKISALEKASLRRLAPEHSYGVGSENLKGSRKLAPFPASSLWADKATLFFCIRRPGCVMCRAEAHQLFARKPIFDALGIQLVAVLLEDIDEEVWAFWPRYWAGMVLLDEKRDFFKALGGGKLMKDSLFTGFFLNPIARLNWKRAVKTGIKYNTRGEGTIKGGMFIIRPNKGGIAYQFAEKNFGDWAPLDEVLEVCHAIREEGDSDGW